MALPIVLKNENEIVRASVKDLNLLPKIEVAQRTVAVVSVACLLLYDLS